MRAKLNFALGFGTFPSHRSDSGSDTNTITIDATPASGGGGPTFTPGYCRTVAIRPSMERWKRLRRLRSKGGPGLADHCSLRDDDWNIYRWIKTASGTG